jgi:putative protease
MKRPLGRLRVGARSQASATRAAATTRANARRNPTTRVRLLVSLTFVDFVKERVLHGSHGREILARISRRRYEILESHRPHERSEKMAEEKIGVVIHYWSNIGVAGVHMTEGKLEVGDTIHIKGHTSDFTQQVDSMQVDNESVEVAKPGDDVGLKVVDHAREHDEVFKVTPE